MKKVKSIALIATTILGITAVTPLIEPAQTAQAAPWQRNASLMIRRPLINHKRPINLLRQHQPHQLVGQRESSE